MKKSGSVLFVVLFSVGASFAQDHPAPSASARAHYDHGIMDLNQGKWEEAGIQFKEAIVADPQYQDAHELYQDVEFHYFEKKQLVIAEYADLVQKHPRDPLVQYLLARILTKQQLDSLGLFISPIALDSSFIPEYQRVLGALLYEGKLDEASTLIEAGLRHSPDNIRLLFRKSELYTRQEKAKESASILERIIQLYPDDEYTMYACIQLARLAQTDSERIQLLEHAVRIDTLGMRSDAYSDLFILYAKNDTARAIQFARSAMRIKQSYQDRRLASQMGSALFGLYVKSDTARAVSFALEVYTDSSEDPQLCLNIGNKLRALNRDNQLAISLVQRALDHHTAGSNYGFTCFGRMSRAAILQNYAMAHVYYLLGLGSGYLANAQYQEALTVYQSALGKNDQADASILFRIGSAYEGLAQPQKAIVAYTKSLGIEEDAKVRSALELLASRESNLNVAIPPKRVADLDSAIAQSQLSSAKHAPEFNLKKLNGGEVSLASLKGKVVIIDYWATWCGPCVAELPLLQKFYEKYKSNSEVRFLAVNTTDVDEAAVKSFIEKHGYTFDVLIDKGTSDSYGVQGIPALFIIDQAGMIRYKHVGFDANVDLVMMLSKEIEVITSGRTGK